MLVFAGCNGDTMPQAAPGRAPPLTFALHGATSGPDDGRIVATPAGFDCSGECRSEYPPGTRLVLSAIAGAGRTFAGWSGDCGGAADCPLLMDQPRSVVAQFEPADDPGPAGSWLAGDLHVHDDHSSDGSGPRQAADDRGPGNVAVQDQIGFAEAMGLDFLPLTDHRTYDQHYDPNWHSDALLLIPGEEANGSPHATVHGAVDSIVQGAGGDDEARRLQQSIWDAHMQGAVWITAHPDDGMVESDGRPNRRADAVGADLVETWNRASDVEAELRYAEARWNAGYRFGVAGASDNHFRELWALAGPGMPTTEVLAGARSERALLQALAAGRTTIHAGPGAPVLRMDGDFDGDGRFEAAAGDERWVPPGTAGRLRIRASQAMGAQVRVFAAPGASAAPIASFSPSLLELEASLIVDVVTPPLPTWYRAEIRALAPPAGLNTGDVPLSLLPDPTALPEQLRAISSPLLVSAAPVAPEPAQPLPPDAGSDDGAERLLGGAGRFAGFPHLAVAAGAAHLVAEQHGPGTTHVIHRRRTADGVWGAAQVLDDSGAARFARVAAHGSRVAVVWQDERAGQQPRRPQILLRQSADGGLSWAAPQVLRALAGRAERPDLAFDADGRLLVAWQEIAPGRAFDVMLLDADAAEAVPHNLSAEGKTVSAGDPLDSRSPRYPASVWPRLAAAPQGGLAVVWQDNRQDVDPLWTGQRFSGEGSDPDDWQIALRRRDAAGVWSALTLVGAPDRADRHPDAAYDGAGRLALVWDSKPLQSSGANLEVLGLADAGSGSGEPAVLGASASGQSQYPQLGRGGDALHAVWHDSRSADWRWRIATARLAGGSWGAAELLDQPGNNGWPALDGGLLVFASSRAAQRPQRDPTQEIYALELAPAPGRDD